MIIEKRQLADLKPAEYNPRQDLKPGDPEYEKIKRSIEEFGYVDPIIINTDGTIIGGHQRYKILLDLGHTEADVSVVDLDKEHEKALNIALNKTGGDWDVEKLKDLLKEIDLSDLDTTLTGFSDEELKKLIGPVELGSDDDFDVDAELQKPTFSKPGDIWHLGRHTVICGDSTDPETYEKLLGDTKVNLVLTDAPYFVDLEGTTGKIKNDDLKGKEAYNFLMKVFTNFHDAMATDASIYEFYATSQSRIFFDAFEDAGFKLLAGLIWHKDRAPLMRTDFKFDFEPVLYGKRSDGTHKWYGDQKQKACIEGFAGIHNAKEEGFGHPSSKSVPLLCYLLQLSTQTNGLVLDGFLGSASTLIACEQSGRTCYGIELEPKFVDVAVERYRQSAFNHDVYVERDGETIMYDDVPKPEEE